jgi:hypothetical protein
VKFPFAAGIEQAIDDEGFEHFEPGSAFLGIGQQRSPEGIEIEAIPELQSEPASAPLAGTGQFDVPEPEFERWMFELRIGRAILWEKMNLAAVVAFIDGLDGAGPSGTAAVVDFAKIEQGLLNGSATGDAPVFHNTPVAMFLAVLESFVCTQKHNPAL